MKNMTLVIFGVLYLQVVGKFLCYLKHSYNALYTNICCIINMEFLVAQGL